MDVIAETFSSKADTSITDRDRIEILLEEYRSLNTLLVFRLTAMDRRLPVSVGVFAATIASVAALPKDTRLAILLALPLALLWLVRTTVQHARAKEDHLRRIDEIERMVNVLARAELLVFQSRHPNQCLVPSGRTGKATVQGVGVSGLVMLGLCAFLFLRNGSDFPTWMYLAYVVGVGLDVVWIFMDLRRYRYRKAAPSPPDILCVNQ